MTTATQLPTIRTLTQSSSAPSVGEWSELDDSELAFYLDARENYGDTYIDDDTRVELTEMRERLAAGEDVWVARDGDGWWFARPDTESEYRDLPATVIAEYDEVVDGGRTLRTNFDYHVSEDLDCAACGSALTDSSFRFGRNGLGTIARHPSGEWHIPCAHCGVIWVAKEAE